VPSEGPSNILGVTELATPERKKKDMASSNSKKGTEYTGIHFFLNWG